MIPVDDLVGMKVLVTGASSGIGAAAATALSRSGAEICLHYHTGKDPAEALADTLRKGWWQGSSCLRRRVASR